MTDRLKKWMATCLAAGILTLPEAGAKQRAPGAVDGCLARALAASQHGDYFVKDPKDSRFYVMGDLEGDILHFRMRLVAGKARSSLRGSEQFAALVRHFNGKFRYIAGDWVARSGLTTNLDQINALTGRPHFKSVEEAARATWTGAQAGKAGYTEVTVLGVVGTPGKYSEIHVVFEKPPEASGPRR